MSGDILAEGRFYLNTVFYGFLIVAAYDVLRIFRRLLRHSFFWISLEDLLFWTVSAFCVFRMFYRYNSGNLRGPALAALLCGMIFWHYAISNPFMRFLTGRIILPVKRRLRQSIQGLQKFFKKCKMFLSGRKKHKTCADGGKHEKRKGTKV